MKGDKQELNSSNRNVISGKEHLFKNNLITPKSATNVHFADNDMIVTLSDGTHLRVAFEKII
ncbi:MAG: hypothetical protein GY801_48780 [bacterium]|nr:hypothetical protein [bacterium]